MKRKKLALLCVLSIPCLTSCSSTMLDRARDLIREIEEQGEEREAEKAEVARVRAKLMKAATRK